MEAGWPMGCTCGEDMELWHGRCDAQNNDDRLFHHRACCKCGCASDTCCCPVGKGCRKGAVVLNEEDPPHLVAEKPRARQR